MYKDDQESPYDDITDVLRVGFTFAAIVQLCGELLVPVCIKWNKCKIEQYSPEIPEYNYVRNMILGNHCYCIEDDKECKNISKEHVKKPTIKTDIILAMINRRENVTP